MASKKYTKLSQQPIPSASWFSNTCQKLCEVTVLLGPSEIEGPVLGMDSFLLSPITATVSTTGKCFLRTSLPLGLLQTGRPVFQSTSNYWQLSYSQGTTRHGKWSHQRVHSAPHVEPAHRTNAALLIFLRASIHLCKPRSLAESITRTKHSMSGSFGCLLLTPESLTPRHVKK